MIRSARCWAAVAAVMMAGLAAPAWAQTPLGTQFTYQGQLSQLGSAASGTYDLRFRLYDDPSGAGQVGIEVCVPNVVVLNGLVTVPVDFGNIFLDQNRWLEIDVRVSTGAGCADTSGYETLAPRQQLTATPHALFSLRAASADQAANATNATNAVSATFATNATQAVDAQQLGGQLPSSFLQLVGPQTVAGPKTFSNANNLFTGIGSGLTSLNASNISTGTLSAARLPSVVARTDQANAFGNFINTFAGNTGFGTLAPNAPLHVSRLTTSNLALFEGSGAVTGVTIRNVGTGGRFWSIFATADGSIEGGGKLTFQDSTSGAGTRMLIDGNGYVGIGTPSPTAPLNVAGNLATPVLVATNSSTAASSGVVSGPAAVEGQLTATTPGQFAPAVRGLVTSTGTNGVGVAGVHVGAGIGVLGQASGVGAYGVYGTATSLTGVTYGVLGFVNSPSGYAGYFNGPRSYVSNKLGIGTLNPTAQLHVSGGPSDNTATFESSLSSGTWLNLNNTSTSGRQWSFISTGLMNTEGPGKLLFRDNTSNNVRLAIDTAGRVGLGTASPTAPLDVLNSASTTGVIVGTNGSSANSASITSGAAGVVGTMSSTTGAGNTAGVRGVALSTNVSTNAGVVAFNAGIGYGLYAQVNGVGGSAVFGNSTTGSGTAYGVVGFGNNAVSYAGYFYGTRTYISQLGVGTVGPSNPLTVSGNANITGSLSKGGGSFKIDHPLDPANKYLYHSFVESPDMMNVYNGEVTTDAEGFATIELPDYFEALNRTFRYQLTVIDEDGGEDFVIAKVVRRIEGNRFTIRTSAPSIAVSWQVTGVRQDAWAERNRIPTTVEKSPEERGLYLHPEAFDLPENKAIFRKPEQHPVPMTEGTPQ